MLLLVLMEQEKYCFFISKKSVKRYYYFVFEEFDFLLRKSKATALKRESLACTSLRNYWILSTSEYRNFKLNTILCYIYYQIY